MYRANRRSGSPNVTVRSVSDPTVVICIGPGKRENTLESSFECSVPMRSPMGGSGENMTSKMFGHDKRHYELSRVLMRYCRYVSSENQFDIQHCSESIVPVRWAVTCERFRPQWLRTNPESRYFTHSRVLFRRACARPHASDERTLIERFPIQ